MENAMELTREITLPATADEVWSSLAEPAWLGEDASIELRPDGEVQAGDRTGFVEEVDEPRRLVFWWSAPGEDATRVELELTDAGEETHLRVVESRPLALLDLYGAEIVFAAPGPRQPELLAR
jgi:uncharacterized protein YndB with AHSA1/START domain